MATEIYDTETAVLLDGEEVELKPLAISKMRKFQRMWADHMKALQEALGGEDEEVEINEADLTDKQYDVFVKMCALSLEPQLKKEGQTEKKFLEYLEDVLDEKTIYRILDVTGGLKLGAATDPNRLPALTPGADGLN